jgi:periplasmic protein TonB
VVARQPKRIRSALVVSFASHALVIFVALTTARMHSTRPTRPHDPQAPGSQRAIFFVDPRPGGGGDAGGQRRARFEDVPLRPQTTARSVAPPKVIAPRIDPFVQPFAPLVPVSFGIQTAEIGSFCAPGDQGDEGSGGGRRGGDGSGDRPGDGPGPGSGSGGRGFGPGGVSAPHVLREVKPQYTADAMNARIQGTVRLECLVRSDGRVGRVRVLRSLDPVFGLDREAIAAARQWVFAPAMRQGAPVDVLVTIELQFALR